MIVGEDYNVQPPSTNDNELEDENHSTTAPISFQMILARSLPLQQRLTRAINSSHEEPSCEEVLALGNELALACGDAVTEIEHACSTGNNTARFASSYCSHLLRRFPLFLHFSFAVKAQKNPLCSYSQQVCLAASQGLVSLLDDGLYRRLLHTGGAMFRDIITRTELPTTTVLYPVQTSPGGMARKGRGDKSWLEPPTVLQGCHSE